jgi:uncharacterized protein (UPF0218 family)
MAIPLNEVDQKTTRQKKTRKKKEVNGIENRIRNDLGVILKI